MITADQVYTLCQQIPDGRVATYGEIARALGCPGAARVVGQFLRKNPKSYANVNGNVAVADLVPCHRVVAKDRTLGGYHGRTDPDSREMQRKIELLRSENVKLVVRGNRIIVDPSAIFTFA